MHPLGLRVLRRPTDPPRRRARLGHFPFREGVRTPDGDAYHGVSFSKKICGVSIIRSGEAMENALRACCKGIKIGKLLIERRDRDGMFPAQQSGGDGGGTPGTPNGSSSHASSLVRRVDASRAAVAGGGGGARAGGELASDVDADASRSGEGGSGRRQGPGFRTAAAASPDASGGTRNALGHRGPVRASLDPILATG